MESPSHAPAAFSGYRSDQAKLHLPCLAGKEARQQHKTQCDWNDKDRELPRKGNISEALHYEPYRKLFLFPVRVWAECDRCCVMAPPCWEMMGPGRPGDPRESCWRQECCWRTADPLSAGKWGKGHNALGFPQSHGQNEPSPGQSV